MANKCCGNGGGDSGEITTQTGASLSPLIQSNSIFDTSENMGCNTDCCSSCNSTPCCCSSTEAACCGPAPITCVTPKTCVKTCPTPYYQQVSLCPEDNTTKICSTIYAAALKVKDSFNIPECGMFADIFVCNLKSIQINSYIWNATYGYLKVTAFDSGAGKITVQNTCEGICGGTAAPGTQVPACTLFTPTAAPCGAGGTLVTGPYLAVDFTAPANGDCILITVTTVAGLVVGKTVQIGAGRYRIDSIDSATTMTICNDGDGAPVGTPVIATDANGNFITPIILIDTNPCTNPVVLTGKVLVCSGGISQPIDSQEAGQVLVSSDDEGNASYQTLAIPTINCTSLTVCLVIDPTLPDNTAYLVSVIDTSNFIVGELVLIQGKQYLVDSILSVTQMRLVQVDPTAVVITYPVGATVCEADCCQQLDLIMPLTAWQGSSSETSPGLAVPAAGDVITGSQACPLITNLHTLFNMRLIESLDASISGTFLVGMTYVLHLETNDNAAGWVIRSSYQSEVFGSGVNYIGVLANPFDVTGTDDLLAPNGGSLQRSIRIRLEVLANGGGTLEDLALGIRLFGIACEGNGP